MSAAQKKVDNEKCAACHRKVVAKGKKYCIYHSQAYDSLQKQHGSWMHAYAGISMGDYMKKLLTLNETGIWIKEVINAELKKEPKKDLGS
jgi:deoxycytidylate deaminase